MYKFAIIGCGRVAPRHAENILKLGELSAVCDIIQEKAKELATNYNAKYYFSIDELLKNEPAVDVVSICTPNGFHAEHVIKSLQARKHVLCEKPLCITSAAAWQIIETEKYSGKKLYVVKSSRYNPLLQQLKKTIVDNTLGKIYSFQMSCFWNRPDAYYTDWRGKLFPDGGTLYTQFSHYIDALLWLFGDLAEVSGYTSNFAHQSSIEFEDTGVAVLQMNSGSLGTLNWSVNSYQKNYEVSLSIIAEHGTISLGGEYLNNISYQNCKQLLLHDQQVIPSTDYGLYKGSMSNHSEVYKNLIEALQNNDHPFANAFDGLRTVEAIEKIYKAVAVNH
jgi:predicted dehydrogenase